MCSYVMLQLISKIREISRFYNTFIIPRFSLYTIFISSFNSFIFSLFSGMISLYISMPSLQSFSLHKTSRIRTILLYKVLRPFTDRSEEHTSELQSRFDLVCRLLLEKKNNGKFDRLNLTS